MSNCIHATPEVTEDYELHFVEFDDQGWLHPVKEGSKDGSTEATTNQIDALMGRLADLMKEGIDLNVVLYVHGWKHNADSGDRDVIQFRELLRSVTTMERGYIEKGPRKTLGIYVGWRGKSWDVPDPILSLTFWTRKSAALRIANGATQELFARLTALQRFYNSPAQSSGCGVARPAQGVVKTRSDLQRCKIRTLMIGHSFGAWILYSAIHSSLIESLNVRRDIPSKDIRSERAERVADLVVLINPAFEASRYETLHRAAQLYQPVTYEAPLIVTITSTSDWATKYAFPAGRFFNVIFEHPTSSEKQSQAMQKTLGHMESYLSHVLTRSDEATCLDWTLPDDDGLKHPDTLRKNKIAEAKNHKAFFDTHILPSGLLKKKWTRPFCGGMILTQLHDEKYENNNPNTLVWNIQTDATLVPGHNEIMGLHFREFVRQLYSDVWRSEQGFRPATGE